jgi:hypothetical protein
MMREQQPIIRSVDSYLPLSRNLSQKAGHNLKKLGWLQLVSSCAKSPQYKSNNQGEQLVMLM